MECRSLLFCLLLLIACSCVHCGPTELTIEVGAGKTECFYASAKVGEYIDIEYQVSNEKNTIGFHIKFVYS